MFAGVGMRFAGSVLLPLLPEHGADVKDATGIARLRASSWSRRLPSAREHVHGRPHEVDDVLLAEGRALPLLAQRCCRKTLDFRTAERRRQDAFGRARVDPHSSTGSRSSNLHVDAGQRLRRAARAARS